MRPNSRKDQNELWDWYIAYPSNPSTPRWCRWQSLLLDDPVQHIDDYRALHLVEVLAAIRRSGRQIIVAVEDAALADLLCRRLRSSIGYIGRRFELRTSKTGTSEIASVDDIYPMPREVLRRAQIS